jgi:hypothetical protein
MEILWCGVLVGRHECHCQWDKDRVSRVGHREMTFAVLVLLWTVLYCRFVR